MLATWRSFTWSSGFATGKVLVFGLSREAQGLLRGARQRENPPFPEYVSFRLGPQMSHLPRYNFALIQVCGKDF